jgi:hypothetical protein
MTDLDNSFDQVRKFPYILPRILFFYRPTLS